MVTFNKRIKLTKPIRSYSLKKHRTIQTKENKMKRRKDKQPEATQVQCMSGRVIGVSLLTAMPDPRALGKQEDGGPAGWGRLSWWGHKSIEDLDSLHETSSSRFTSHCTFTLTTQSSRSLDKTTWMWLVLKWRMSSHPHHRNRRAGLTVLQSVLEHSWMAPVPTQQKALNCRASPGSCG